MPLQTETLIDDEQQTTVRETHTDDAGEVVCVTTRTTPKPGTRAAIEAANTLTLHTALDAVLSDLRTYASTANSEITNAMTVRTLKLLCRGFVAMVRLQRNALDAAD